MPPKKAGRIGVDAHGHRFDARLIRRSWGLPRAAQGGKIGGVSNDEDLPDDESLPPGDDQVPGFDEPGEDADESEADGIVPT